MRLTFDLEELSFTESVVGVGAFSAWAEPKRLAVVEPGNIGGSTAKASRMTPDKSAIRMPRYMAPSRNGCKCKILRPSVAWRNVGVQCSRRDTCANQHHRT